MPILLVLAAGAVALTVPVVWWVVATDRSRALGARNLTLGLQSAVHASMPNGGSSAGSHALASVVRPLAAFSRRLLPPGVVRALERRVVLAGLPRDPTLERALATKLVLGAGGLLLGLSRLRSSSGGIGLMVGVFLPAVGFRSPDIVLQSRGERRQRKIGIALSDTLDQITVSVEAGLGFEAAMARAGRSGKGPLAEELLRTLQDVQAGMSRSEAMRRLADRTEVAELRHFVLALLQADSYGLPIAQVLRVQSRELRVKRRQLAEERAMKLPVKMLFPLVLCILPALFIVLMGPAVIRLSDSVFGGR